MFMVLVLNIHTSYVLYSLSVLYIQHIEYAELATAEQLFPVKWQFLWASSHNVFNGSKNNLVLCVFLC